MREPTRARRTATAVRRAALPLLGVVIVAAVSVAGWVQDRAVEEANAVRRVDAVVLSRPGTPPVLAWPVPGGGTRTGSVPPGSVDRPGSGGVRDAGARVDGPAPGARGTAVGTVAVWLDASGTPVRPHGVTAARERGLVAGASVLVPGVLALLLAWWGTARRADRAWRRLVDREWAAVEPGWSDRTGA